MPDFKSYLDKTGEIGYVDQVSQAIVYVSGLPHAKPGEVILFEAGEMGQVLSLSPDYVEVLLLSKNLVKVGTKAARTDKLLEIQVGEDLLGKTVNALVLSQGRVSKSDRSSELRPINPRPPGLNVRKNIDKPFETGVSLVDLTVPLGKGQRELLIGNRKTGKTQLLLRTLLTQAQNGTVCIYAAIAKKRNDLRVIEEFIKRNNIQKNTIVVASSSADPAGLVYATPYSAMTIAEFFRDKGRDVLIILDDLSTHAKYYREISLLARRFPGRSSYPGDIFYIHSRLLERAGNFVLNNKEVSITCLPVGEMTLSDLSGYIPTNLMAMTDGHIYFDSNLYNEGRRPAVNNFLSVTRVGLQAQTLLSRDLNRQVTSFLVHLKKLREFMHFGAELSESTKRTLAMGDRMTAFFNQSADEIIPVNASIFVMSALWGGSWKETDIKEMNSKIEAIITAYKKDNQYKTNIDNLIKSSKTFDDLVKSIRNNDQLVKGK